MDSSVEKHQRVIRVPCVVIVPQDGWMVSFHPNIMDNLKARVDSDVSDIFFGDSGRGPAGAASVFFDFNSFQGDDWFRNVRDPWAGATAAGRAGRVPHADQPLWLAHEPATREVPEFRWLMSGLTGMAG